jgi:hypothetical protein
MDISDLDSQVCRPAILPLNARPPAGRTQERSGGCHVFPGCATKASPRFQLQQFCHQTGGLVDGSQMILHVMAKVDEAAAQDLQLGNPQTMADFPQTVSQCTLLRMTLPRQQAETIHKYYIHPF